MKKSKKGQITIFVIIALIIVAIIIILFVILRTPFTQKISVENPRIYLEDCIKKSLEKNEKLILDKNFYLNLDHNFVLYSKEKVPYLCISGQFYAPCINQEPMLIEFVRKEIESLTHKDAEICFSDLIDQLRKSDYKVQESDMTFSIILQDKIILADIKKEIIIEKNEDKRVVEIWDTKISSSLFQFLDTARNIVNFESTLCEFDSLNWMRYYSDILIKKFVASDQSKIYSLEDKLTEQEVKFAVKTCVLPAGI
mgnify:CR=1 FL=1